MRERFSYESIADLTSSPSDNGQVGEFIISIEYFTVNIYSTTVPLLKIVVIMYKGPIYSRYFYSKNFTVTCLHV